MYVVKVKTSEKHNVEISLVQPSDFKVLTKKEYFFNWKLERDFEIFKIFRVDESEILGLASIERIPEEFRIHLRLMSVSAANKGSKKEYTRIIGNLLTYISKLAVRDFAELACVSLKPKGAIAEYYIQTYGMNVTGATLSLEILEIFKLIEKFDDDKNE